VQLVERSADRLVTWCEPGASVQSYRGSRIGTRNILSHFWLGRPYVLYALWNSSWQPQSLYIDIATAT
jgi:hypothetical protein